LTHDAAHKSNVTEIIIHVKMANEESHNYCRTYQTSETISNQDSQKLNNTIHAIKIQLSEINTVSKK